MMRSRAVLAKAETPARASRGATPSSATLWVISAAAAGAVSRARHGHKAAMANWHPMAAAAEITQRGGDDGVAAWLARAGVASSSEPHALPDAAAGAVNGAETQTH